MKCPKCGYKFDDKEIEKESKHLKSTSYKHIKTDEFYILNGYKKDSITSFANNLHTFYAFVFTLLITLCFVPACLYCNDICNFNGWGMEVSLSLGVIAILLLLIAYYFFKSFKMKNVRSGMMINLGMVLLCIGILITCIGFIFVDKTRKVLICIGTIIFLSSLGFTISGSASLNSNKLKLNKKDTNK